MGKTGQAKIDETKKKRVQLTHDPEKEKETLDPRVTLRGMGANPFFNWRENVQKEFNIRPQTLGKREDKTVKRRERVRTCQLLLALPWSDSRSAYGQGEHWGVPYPPRGAWWYQPPQVPRCKATRDIAYILSISHPPYYAPPFGVSVFSLTTRRLSPNTFHNIRETMKYMDHVNQRDGVSLPNQG